MAEPLAPPAAPAPTISVDTLALSLPAGLERRAARIGRLTAEALAAAPPRAREAHLPVVIVQGRTMRPHWSDQRIASDLARAIRERIEGGA